MPLGHWLILSKSVKKYYQYTGANLPAAISRPSRSPLSGFPFVRLVRFPFLMTCAGSSAVNRIRTRNGRGRPSSATSPDDRGWLTCKAV